MINRVLLGLIEQVYAAALDPAQWPTFLDNFAEAFRGEQATFFSHDLRDLHASFHACARIDEAFIKILHRSLLRNEHLRREIPHRRRGRVHLDRSAG